MRAQPTIVALERGLTPEALCTDIAPGAAASAREKAAREEKVKSTPSAATTTCGRLCARRRRGPGTLREQGAGFDEREAVYERWREGRATFGRCSDRGGFYF